MNTLLNKTLALGLLLCTSALSGCLFLGEDEPQDDDTICPAIYEFCPEGSSQVPECAEGARCVVINDCGRPGDICQYDDTAQCAAIPTCDADEVQIAFCQDGSVCGDACQGDSDCRAVSLCGQTAFCKKDGIATCQAYPVCPEGTYEVEECPADASCVTRSLCGYTITCAKDQPNHCEAYPSCEPGTREVPACADNGRECGPVSLCGYTIYCEEELSQCAAVPVCPPDTVEVEQCEPNAHCFTETRCGSTILCQSFEGHCDAVPVCPEGTRQVQDCTDNGQPCQYVSVCGQTIACVPDLVQCQAIPVCPPGAQQVAACPPNAAVECEQVSMCGQTITCAWPLGCGPQDARGVGLCDAFFGYAWDGESCVGLSGCNCQGADCGQTYQSIQACEQAHSFCP